MDDKTRARNYYAAAVILFQDASKDDCEIVVELLEKAFNLYSDLDVLVFIGEVWHYLLKSLDRHNELGTYEKYRSSPAWERKRDLVIERDKGKCVWCQAAGKQVHHKTYENIGKEPLSDLVVVCGKCHEKEHHLREPSDQKYGTQQVPCALFDSQPATQQRSEAPIGKAAAKEAFIAYIARESDILQLSDSDRSGRSDYVNYDTGYPTKSGFPEIQLSVWLPVDYNDVAAVISIRSDSKYFESHYKKLEAHKSEIEKRFSFQEVKFRQSRDGKMYHLRVVKKGVDLTQAADRDAAFHWLHENLEKLHRVLHEHDTL